MPVDRRADVEVVIQVNDDLISLVRLDKGTRELVIDRVDLARITVGSRSRLGDVEGELSGGLSSVNFGHDEQASGGGHGEQVDQVSRLPLGR